MNLSLPMKVSLKRKICPSHHLAPQTCLLLCVILFSWCKTYLLFNKMFVLFLLALSFTKKIIKATVPKTPGYSLGQLCAARTLRNKEQESSLILL